ncbi:MAG TPA: intradiol ring-cleavage dioxygenase [Patescibacteria group bacterium]|nr:intradiol ring-cleavage dioxygenase [Patescibacteria group bacterium]
MRDFDEHNITDAVIDRIRNTPDPRLKTIMTHLVRHLHDFVREVDLTFDEWLYAVRFLTRTGQICSDSRQEFVLLSDTLGISMLVDAINHRMPEGATATTVLGPFYVDNPPEFPLGFDISRGLKGERLFVQADVRSASGGPLENVVVDVWQSDTDGYYDVQRPDLTEPTLRGRFRPDSQGRFHFWSILPSPYPIANDGPVGQMLVATARHPWRPAHLHFMISADGHEKLITHVFPRNDPYLDSDAVFGVKNSLIANYTQEGAGVAPDGKEMKSPWRKLVYHFGLKRLA